MSLVRFLALVGVSLGIASASFGQMQLFGTFEGKRLPVVAHDDEALVVQNGGRRDRTHVDIEVRPSKNFAEGMVTKEATAAK